MAVADTAMSWARVDTLALMALLSVRPHEHEQPVDGHDGSGNGRGVAHDAGTVGTLVGQVEVEGTGDTDFDTYIYKYADDTHNRVAEVPGAVLRHLFLSTLVQMRLGYVDKRDDEECCGEDGHAYPQQGGDVDHRGRLGQRADEGTHKERGEGGRERVERTAGLNELVAFVAAAAQNVEHGVYHGVEHAHAEAADEGTEQIDEVIDRYGELGYLQCATLLDAALHCEEYGVGTHDARQVLYGQAHNAYGHGPKGGLLVSDFHQQVTGRYSHEEVGQEVHHVAHHAQHAITYELIAPDGTDGGGQVGYKREIIAKMKNIVMMATIFLLLFFSCIITFLFIYFYK